LPWRSFRSGFARLVRGNTLVLKQQTFIESARSIGASDMTILFSHILPGTVSSIVVYFTMRIGVSIISAASLSFLGLGRSRRRRSGARCSTRRARIW
jgi:glutathione transport system permease protein